MCVPIQSNIKKNQRTRVYIGPQSISATNIAI